jgi:hypothetical protein
MNELLAQIYGTSGATTEEPIEKTAEAALLDELEKVAAAEGIDLGELSDEDIVEILNEAVNTGDNEKTAEATEADADADDGEEGQVKLAEADFLGRAMAHAFYNELSQIGSEVEKTAAEVDPTEAAAVARAEEILAAASEKVDTSEKTASDEAPKDRLVRLMGTTKEATEDTSDDDALTARALEILDANDYDVDKIVELLT